MDAIRIAWAPDGSEFGRDVPRQPRIAGGAKGRNTNETSSSEAPPVGG